MSDVHVLSVAKLSPLLAPQLAAAFQMHDRLHELDPAALARVAPQVRGLAAVSYTHLTLPTSDLV